MELGCCPVCGGTTTGTLDHYLPRDVYPEFSIFSLNLVPACPHCNSGSKGTTVKGASYGERFLHPYFDDLANGPIWRVAFRAPYAMLTFDAVPEQGLSPAQTKMVKFHLQNVLGSQFETFVRTQWGKMPNVLRIRAGGRLPTDPVACRPIVELELAAKIEETGSHNSWHAGFLRGLLADNAATAHLLATSTVPPIIPTSATVSLACALSP
jgi:hypothetical protein